MTTSETRANDPFSVALTPEDIKTCAFPDGNYGYGVLIEPTKDGRWRLTPAPEPEEHKQRRLESRERIAARRTKGKVRMDKVLSGIKGLGLEITEVPMQPAGGPASVDLPEVVVSSLPGGAWKVEGYWNLVGAWRVRGTFDWPFQGTRYGRVYDTSTRQIVPEGPLVSCCVDGTTFVPRVPTFAEAEAWIVAQKLRAPPFECGCGAVHAAGGEVVGLCITPPLEIKGFLIPGDVRLIAREDGHQRFRECLPQEVLDLRMCALLKHVEPGGMRPSEWNRKHGDEAARVQEAEFDRRRAEADAQNAKTLEQFRSSEEP